MSTALAEMKALLGHVAQGKTLSPAQAEKAFDIIMSGDATPSQIGGLLMALRVRGETVEEITGAARVMRAKALPIEAPEGAIDSCGTGGDGAGTWNVSTAVALVVAAAGVPMAKHGNRALTSKSGAADVLTALGVNIEADMSLIRQALFEARIGFLMAPRHHSAMRHVMPTRLELGTRTLFNLLGPLTNPAGVKRQLVGVYSRDWIAPLAEVLGRLGSERAWVVHGSDGLDEMTTTGPTYVAELKEGRVHCFEVAPEAVGLSRASPDALKGSDPESNAAALRALLKGETGAYRDIVLLNAAACLVVAEKAPDLPSGIALAAQAIDDGAAWATLEKLVAITNNKAAS